MIDINLIAARRQRRQRAAMMMRFAVYSVIGLLVLIGLVYAWLAVATNYVQSQIGEKNAQLSDPKLKGAVERLGFLEGRIAGLRPRVELLQKVHDSEAGWVRVLGDLSDSLPPDVWVNQLSSRRSEQGQYLTLRGSALSQGLLGDFMLRVKQTDWSGVPVLQESSKAPPAAGRAEVVEFEVNIPLQHALGII
jgi:Tfp pilus assembly protein PilN